MSLPSNLSGRTLIAYLAFLMPALASSGCLAVAAGAAGGAAVGYAYYKGKVCVSYNANFEDSWNAVRAALIELGMTIQSEDHNADEGGFNSRTASGDQVRVELEAVPSKFPAEGNITRVYVRVATFGDQQASERILAQVGLHLVPITATAQTPHVAAPQTVVPAGATAAATPLPGQTAPPPIAPVPSPPQTAPPGQK